MSEKNYTGIIKTVLGCSRFIAYNPQIGEIFCVLKKTVKVKYKSSKSRIFVNSLVEIQYNEDFKKGIIIKKYSQNIPQLKLRFKLTDYEV